MNFIRVPEDIGSSLAGARIAFVNNNITDTVYDFEYDSYEKGWRLYFAHGFTVIQPGQELVYFATA
jgi:hypothetical protein